MVPEQPVLEGGCTVAEVISAYCERQVRWQCGIHAINNALGRCVLKIDGLRGLIEAGKAWRHGDDHATRPAW